MTNPFRVYEAAVDAAVRASNVLRRQEQVPAYGLKSAEMLSAAIKSLRDAGLFGNVEKVDTALSNLMPREGEIATRRILTGHSATTTAIVDIAQKEGLPVIFDDRGNPKVAVSPEVSGEDAPQILLKALAAYANQNNLTHLAGKIENTAEELKNMARDIGLGTRNRQ